jgi:hypothetical protein
MSKVQSLKGAIVEVGRVNVGFGRLAQRITYPDGSVVVRFQTDASSAHRISWRTATPKQSATFTPKDAH